jgi:alpha-L-fucosidase 2
MPRLSLPALFLSLAVPVISTAEDPVPASSAGLKLWYDKPAGQAEINPGLKGKTRDAWCEALPVGNGRLGAMVFGGTAEERIQFNECTLWTGEPHEYQHEGAAAFLPEIRKLLAEGKQKQAEDLAMKEFMSLPLHQMEYQPFGDLRLHFPGHDAATGYGQAPCQGRTGQAGKVTS